MTEVPLREEPDPFTAPWMAWLELLTTAHMCTHYCPLVWCVHYCTVLLYKIPLCVAGIDYTRFNVCDSSHLHVFRL